MCHIQAECSNTEDGFNCVCSSGFMGNGFACTDINECKNGQNDCNSNAMYVIMDMMAMVKPAMISMNVHQT